MQRNRLKNIISKSKTLSQTMGEPYDLFVQSLPSKLNYYKDGGKYRLKAAWKAYGKPKDYQEALWNGLVETIGGTLSMPSIGYNEENDSYEYLNKGRENEKVSKDIRVWDNDVIPFVRELKLGGYIKIFDEEEDCWKYKKGGKTEKPDELPKKDKPDQSLTMSPLNSPEYLVSLIKNSLANFAKRLLDPNRKYLTFDDGSIGTHKLSYATGDNGMIIVYPEILEINGKLIDLSSDRKNAVDSAIKNGDYIIFPSESDAQWFTANNYKKYFPGLEKYAPEAFKLGGQMNVIPEGALHAHKNHMELAEEKEITSKGIPVVSKNEDGEVILHAEVEREELTLTKLTTEKIENWYEKFFSEEVTQKEKDEIAIKCGKFITKEILFNTDDRVNLISKLLEEYGNRS